MLTRIAMTITDSGKLTLVLVCDDPLVEAVVRASCPPPHRVACFARREIVNRQRTISDHGLDIVRAASGADVVLIDWALEEAPAINTLCFHVRRDLLAPVLVLCREGPEAMAACVAAGGDDALTFPLSLPYVQAKVLAYRRLIQAVRQHDETAGRAVSASPEGDRAVRRFGALRLDPAAHRFYVREEEVPLTPREFALLDYLIAHAGALCTRDQILDAVWGITFDTGTNMVDVYMHFLRKKLEAYGLDGMIQTVRGHGYRLEALGAPDS